MPKKISVVAAAVLSVLVPMLPRDATAEEPIRLAMMEMMPSGEGAMQPPAPGAVGMPGMPAAPTTPPAAGGAGGMMDDDKSRMGAGMPGQAPTGQAQQQPMSMCPMCAKMMQGMMGGAGAPSGMSAMGGSAAMGGVLPAGSSAARLEGSIAFLRTELRITDAQAPAWDAFAATLRAGREHLDAARAALQDSSTGTDPLMRLESYENHLKARTEAIHMTRLAFTTLQGQLDEPQKRTATSTMLPFIGTF
ncbi:Spy/CpxP family protein refolding chaperone [Paeniroseomonas aquatica]|uniref:Spy/CpxP family protein refolding chaperone n=1 Tax=Paeniroseomonas aquatica TaxID=373043 RepID=A0ABT8A2B2_9PROT|nr:Spy/CpxP family protein refolding chaperone [Paeniroseomonas aquatica]MDN3563874.1 Spy/CpxP family protein refolding chaperone [Paeniroseomonas aquatica]